MKRFPDAHRCIGPVIVDGGIEPIACAGEATIALIQKPHGTQAEHTAISFEVSDVIAEVKELEKRGVVFEDYDLPGLKTVEHVCVLGSDRAAWFKDPEGNILCVHQSGAAPV